MSETHCKATPEFVPRSMATIVDITGTELSATLTGQSLTGVSIVSWVHHGEDHNACRVVVIIAHDMRIDLMWVRKANASPN